MSYKLADIIWNDKGDIKMNKELSPLENWKEVKDYLNYCLYDIAEDCKALCYTSTSQFLQPYIDNVEAALTNYLKILPEHEDTTKKLKVLEIIKEKKVNIDNFLYRIKEDTDYEEYKMLCETYIILIFSKKELTKEEFDLLKEVLVK